MPGPQAASGASRSLLQRLLDILDQIVDMLDADRQPHQIRGAHRSGPFDAGAMLGETVDRSERSRPLEYTKLRGKYFRGLLAAGETQRHHPPEPAAHLLRGNGVTGVRRKP